MMKMKTLLSLSLLALPFFTAKVNAENVALAVEHNLAQHR
jgi:3-dehydroquinate dehydratase-1